MTRISVNKLLPRRLSGAHSDLVVKYIESLLQNAKGSFDRAPRLLVGAIE